MNYGEVVLEGSAVRIMNNRAGPSDIRWQKSHSDLSSEIKGDSYSQRVRPKCDTARAMSGCSSIHKCRKIAHLDLEN